MEKCIPSQALALLALIYLGPIAYSQDFYPHEIKNSWRYKLFLTSTDTSEVQVVVESDTVMPNGRVYAQLSHPDILESKFVREDSSFIYYYSQADSSEHRIFNLRSQPGTTDSIRWMGSLVSSRLTTIRTISIFGQLTTARSYSLGGIQFYDVTLAEGFGIVNGENQGGGAPTGSVLWTLQGCFLRDTVFGVPVSVSTTTNVREVCTPLQNYPNPFNPTTTIIADIPRTSTIDLSIVNTLGQTVKVLLAGSTLAGRQQIKFDGSGLASGLYVVVLRTPEKTYHRKMLLLH